MFNVIWNNQWKTPVDVYAVDPAHNTFLIDAGGKFMWVDIDEFIPMPDDY